MSVGGRWAVELRKVLLVEKGAREAAAKRSTALQLLSCLETDC